MLMQQFVERVDHIRDFEILGLVDRADETLPEIAQQVAPCHFAVGYEVELFLKVGGEIVLNVFRKETLEKRHDDTAAVLGDEAALVDTNIFAVPEDLQDRSISRRPAD